MHAPRLRYGGSCLRISDGAIFQLTKGIKDQTYATFSPDGSSVLFNVVETFASSRIPKLSIIPFSLNAVEISQDQLVRDRAGETITLFGFAAVF